MSDKKKNIAWLIFARLFIVSIFLGAIAYFNIKLQHVFPDEMLKGVTRLIILTCLLSIVSLIALKYTDKYLDFLGFLQVMWDILFVAILILLTGGSNSTYSFFFNLTIISASYLFGRKEAFYTAGICSIIYGLIVDLHLYGKLEFLYLYTEDIGQNAFDRSLSLIFTNLLAFFLSALLTGYLAERARLSESALHEREIDYAELEELNSIIVSSLDSGLITVNSQGRVRVFNRYASIITGIDQQDAYNINISMVFPSIDFPDPHFINSRRELPFVSKDGVDRILSLKYAPLSDKDGNELGAVIDFKDMTEIRAMETRLKKADRLAAIGELSARIAHEVRNPLASISGSVQLISESGQIPEDDRRLMDIIQRETWRLDKMLGDFLQYAKPAMPNKSSFELYELVSDLIIILKGDSRFYSIVIETLVEPKQNINADRSQIQQVLWNLLLNAAEAMPNGGKIVIKSFTSSGFAADGKSQISYVGISISDTGHGVPKEQAKLLFEPFFTTKQGGSGIGLASVYRILEAHGGNISLSANSVGGAVFTILLPSKPE